MFILCTKAKNENWEWSAEQKKIRKKWKLICDENNLLANMSLYVTNTNKLKFYQRSNRDKNAWECNWNEF